MVSGGNCWLNSCLVLYFEDDDTALTVSPSLNTKGWTIGGKSKHVDYLEYVSGLYQFKLSKFSTLATVSASFPEPSLPFTKIKRIKTGLGYFDFLSTVQQG